MAKKKMVSKGKATNGKQTAAKTGPKKKSAKSATGSRASGTKRGKKSSPTPAKPTQAPAKEASAAKAKTASQITSGKLSALDAAVRVLNERGKPMQVKPLVQAMIEKGYWASSGKTPWATLHAAICREVSKKGKESRFKKVGRGQFTVNG